LALSACGLCAAGCNETKQQAAADAAAAPQQNNKAPIRAMLFPSDAKTIQSDAMPAVPIVVQVNSYKITLPAGAVSRSTDFWKRVNEKAVDVATYDLLYKNGVRVGIGASSEWEYLKGVLEQNPAQTQRSTATGSDVKDLDSELKLKVPYQDLFYYDASGELVGRTHERCDNLLRMAFQSAPRKPDTVRITICPVIRSLRERIVPVGDVNTRSYPFVHPEQLYDLNLVVDVPFDGFLVVAPSPEAKWPTSLGSNFLVDDGSAEQKETLLVFRPIPFRAGVAPEATAGGPGGATPTTGPAGNP
jgi:hypothetical protein